MPGPSRPRPTERDLDLEIRHAFALLHTDPEQAQVLAQNVFEAASELSYASAIVRSSSALMALHEQRSAYVQALAFVTPELEARLGQASGQAQASYWNTLGIVHHRLGQLYQAMACFSHVLGLEDGGTPAAQRASLRNNIGNVLNDLEAYADADRFFEEARALLSDLAPASPSFFTNVAGHAIALRHLGRAKDALTMLQRALASEVLPRYPRIHAVMLGNLATVHRWLGQHDQALRYGQLLLDVSDNFSDFRSVGHLELGLAHAAQGRDQAALRELRAALELSSGSDAVAHRQFVHSALMEFHERRGEYQAALHHQKAARTLEIEWFGGSAAERAGVIKTLLAVQGGRWPAGPVAMAPVSSRADRQAQSARDRLLAHLAAPADRDPLTGLLTPDAWRAQLERRLAEAAGRSAELALVHLDLDHFQQVQQRFGSSVADAVICAVAGRLVQRLGPAQQLGRVGVDTFAVVLPGRAPEIGPLLNALAQPIQALDQAVGVTASAGVAHFPAEADSAGALTQQADSALLDAKRRGRQASRRAEAAQRPEERVDGAAPPALTGRELEVLRLLAQGHSNKAIGQQLGISPYTARHHVTSILAKTGTKSRTEAVATALQRGWLDQP